MRPGLLSAAVGGRPDGGDEHVARPMAEQLAEDLGLSAVIDAMAGGDAEISSASRSVLLSVPPGRADVAHRHGVLADVVREPGLPRELYHLAGRALDAQRGAARATLSNAPEALLTQSVTTLTACLDLLRDLRLLADRYRGRVTSAGLTRFFAMTAEQFDETYLRSASGVLDRLPVQGDVLVSARPGPGGDSVDLRVHQPVRRARGLFRRGGPDGVPSATWSVANGDEAGHRALQSLRDQALAEPARAAERSAAHVLSFFSALRSEVAFYLGCLNLRHALAERGAAVCLPVVEPSGPPVLRARGLYDPALQLRLDEPVVSNDLDATGMTLVMVTGANRGGKSTFLRSVGLAELMTAAGTVVAADSYRTSVRTCVLTHVTRDEDDTRLSGKLDEELRRMSQLADVVSPGGLVLMNESFQSTNEREGSDIAREVVDALTASGVVVVFVTHLHELARRCWDDREQLPALFLRAALRPDGHRSFRLEPGAPETSSHGTPAVALRVLLDPQHAQPHEGSHGS